MFSELMAILTESTCGATCWYAKEPICRCSCGGKNHGAMLDPDGSQPERVCKIDGYTYRLEAVGLYNHINDLAHKALLRLGWRRIDSKITYGDGTPYHYQHFANDGGAAIRVKTASGNQKQWPEVQLANIQSPKTAYLLWVQVDMPDPVWCEDPTCDRCIERKFTIWEQEDPPKSIEWDFE